MGNPRRAFLVFDGYAYPYVRGRASVGIAAIHIVPEPRAPLGQDLVRVPIGRLHRVEYPIDEGCRYGLLDEIAHRVYDNHTYTAPAPCDGKPVGEGTSVEVRVVYGGG